MSIQMLEWQQIVSIEYLENNAHILRCHWNWQPHHIQCITFFISKNTLFFNIQFNSKHVKPNIGITIKMNIILITTYLNLNLYIIKKKLFNP